LHAVPLFPLPNVVLFPRAVLPLHIFEQRYRAMIAVALEGDQRIAMALLRPGWEKRYHERAEIEPVVCTGTIVAHERFADGKYNILLQGDRRARIVRELHADTAYRMAELEPLPEIPVLEIDVEPLRRRLTEVLERSEIAGTQTGGQFLKLLRSPWSTADIADMVAYNYFEDIPLKQSILAESSVMERIKRVLQEITRLTVELAEKSASRPPPDLN
jgi:Lon protease-like protein